MFRIWLLLFLSFSTYTVAVYKYCDPKEEREPGRQIANGWKTWQGKNCQSCHQIYGLGGYLGPDVTNVASDPIKDEQYIRVIIKYGTSKMPNFNLTDSEINDLVAFLKWVDKSGKSRVSKEKVTWLGNYNLDN